MKKVFLTGGTGTIGRTLVPKLLKTGYSVTILTRNPEQGENLEKKGMKIVNGDINQCNLYKNELLDSDIVIHMAANISIGNLDEKTKRKLIKTNVEGSKKIFGIFKGSSCDQLVFTSTRQIYGNTNGVGDETSAYNGLNQSLYVKTKYYGHKMALEMIKEDLPVTVIIPGTIYSPENTDNGINRLFRLYYAGKRSFLCTKSYNTYVDSEDAADGIIASISTKKAIGEKIIVSNGYTTYENLYSICEKITGNKLRSINIPLILGKFGANFISPVLFKFGKNPLLNKETLNNLKSSCQLSNEKSIDMLNMKYKPFETSISDSFQKMFELLKKKSIE